MADETDREVRVTFAEGVREDIASLIAASDDDDAAHTADIDTLKRRIAKLLVECKANPYVGDLMGPGRHAELANCRRVRFDIPTHAGKPRFRLIYRNEPSDGAPAECRWLAVAPRAGLGAHRRAQQRSDP
ncbi:MAG: hypothetical protein ACLP7W_13210 [Solirubrobacteraceae bacterium]|jgi:hypothetical protein